MTGQRLKWARTVLLLATAVLFVLIVVLYLRTGRVPLGSIVIAGLCLIIFLVTGRERPRGGRAAGREDQGE